MRRVVVSGLGAITPLGASLQHTWHALIAGKSGIVNVPRGERWDELPCRVGGIVPTPLETPLSTGDTDTSNGNGRSGNIERKGRTGDGLWRPDDWLRKGDERRMARFTQYALAAAEMAMADAGWKPERGSIGAEMTGVAVGSGIGNFEEVVNTSVAYEKGGYKTISPLFVPRLLTNLASGHISIKHGLQGPNHAVTTACTTGAHAIGDASRFIAFGDADVMVCGGSESCIHPLAFGGFARSRSLSTNFNHAPWEASRPFDAHRDGFVIGEGAGIMVLEEREHALARGARIYAEILGYGASGDAHHMTAPRVDGGGALLAMRRALRSAGVKPREVGYINAHATGTKIGDAAENAAIGTLMLGDDGVERKGEVQVSSTKGAVGHLLGAAGAVEAIFAVLAIREGIVPPTLNLRNPSPGFEFNYTPLHAQEKTINVAMTNSFGFGGTNSSLVFGAPGFKKR